METTPSLSVREFSLQPDGETLVCFLSSAMLGFTPESVWNPSPSRLHHTDPWPLPQVLHLGVRPNELTSAKFSPPPMAVVISGGGRRWFIGIAADAGWHRWNEVRFSTRAEGVHLSLDLEGLTDPDAAARHLRVHVISYREDLPFHTILADGLAIQYGQPAPRPIPEWWLRPIYCGWGDQVAHAMLEEGIGRERRAMAYCIEGLYNRWIRCFEEAAVPVGSVIVDGGWSLTGVWEPDPIRWPEMRAFIQRQHEAGRKVLLWIGTWLWDGLSPDLCIKGDGRQWTADPTNPRYLEKVRQWVTHLLSPDGLNADGFKIDQLGYSPDRRRPRWTPRFGFSEEGTKPVEKVEMAGDLWGIELLYHYQKAIYEAAKAAKPDALITSSTVHAYFHDTFDMVRLHDMGAVAADLMAAMKARSDLARATLPYHPIDTDDWIHGDYDLWLAYTSRSHELGVPCLFYTEAFVAHWKMEPGTRPVSDLPLIAAAWEKAGYGVPGKRGATDRPVITNGYQSE